MKAIQIKQAGSVSELEYVDCDVPHYGADDVLIQVKIAGINYIDIYTRNGYGSYKPSQYPYILGKEGSGIIKAVGNNVSHFKPGDRVAFCFAGSGSYAEYVAIPAKQIFPLPDYIPFEIGAAVMLQGLTAYYLSHKTFALQAGQTALIHAGAGGVGLLLIQMAKLRQARVITTVSSDEKAKLAKAAGADDVINYTQESFLARVNELTQGIGVNVVYDAVGKTTFDDSMKSLAIRGMLVSYGQSSGPVQPIETARLAEKSLFLTRPILVHYLLNREEANNMCSALFDDIKNGKLQITIGQRYPLADIRKAHADLESRKTVGKSILIV